VNGESDCDGRTFPETSEIGFSTDAHNNVGQNTDKCVPIAEVSFSEKSAL